MKHEASVATGMRVLHIGKYFPPAAGGIESFLSDLLWGLKQEGVQTAALVHDDVPFRGHPVASKGGNSIYRVPAYGSLLYAPVSPGFPAAMERVLREFNPDLLHLHLPNTSAFWVLVSRHARRIPWIIHWHADVVPSKIDTRMALAYRFYQPFERALLRRARSVIVTSSPYLETSAPLSSYRPKSHVIPLGLKAERYDQLDAHALEWAEHTWGSKKKLRVLTIGRLTYYKGHEVLLDAARRTSNITVVIVGEGDRRRKLEELIAELDLGHTAQLTGFLGKSKLNALLASCDCFCLPSLERTEAFGMVLLEAMCFGKPVIASQIKGSGISFVVQHGKTGFLVPPGDPELLSAALTVMANSPNLLTEMGGAAESRFNRHFRIEGIARQTLNHYRGVCAQETCRVSQRKGSCYPY